MKKRILMIGTALNSQGGISQLQKTILENWPDCRYEIRHLVTHEDGSGLFKLYIFLKSVFQFIFIRITYKPGLIHAHFSINASIFRKSFFVLLSKLLHVKIILHSHTGEIEPYLEKMNRIKRTGLLFALHLTDGLIILGTKDINIYQKYYKKSKLFVLKNPVQAQTTSARLDGSQIISVGSLGTRKGTYDLVKASGMVHKKFPEAKFLLAGDGDTEIVKKLIQDNSIQNIRVTGWQTSEQVRQHLLQSSIFALPSYYEGMPIAILEAMSFGLPVISTDVNGIPDLVIDGETGILITPGDIDALENAILKLLNEPETRKSMGEKGKARVENLFSTDVVINKLCQIYDDLLLSNHDQ